MIWFVMLGLYLGLQTLTLPPDLSTPVNLDRLAKLVNFINKLLVVLGILSITFATPRKGS